MTTSTAAARNDTWPFVTIPHFELRGDEMNKLANSDQITFVPLVKQELRQDWEAYALEQRGWLNESLHWQEQLVAHNKTRVEIFDRALGDETMFPKKLWGFEDGESGKKVPLDDKDTEFGIYAPVWQQSPAPARDPSIINYDLLSRENFRRYFHGMWESRLPVLSMAMDVAWLTGGALVDHRKDPKSLLLSPVYPFFSVKLHDRNSLSGVLVSVIHWENYFLRLLVDGTNGYELVLHNTCGESFTYVVNGPEATYMGEGDLHDDRYSGLGVKAKFASIIKHNVSNTTEHCEYDMAVYPTATLEETYRTNRPALYTCVVLMVFLFTALVFLLYDILVQRRQDKVMATAKRTNAIVSSLFPSNVRDRILQDAAEQAEADVKDKKAFGGGFGRNKFKDVFDEDNLEPGETIRQSSKPIADLYPEVSEALDRSAMHNLQLSRLSRSLRMFIIGNGDVRRHCWVHGLVQRSRARTCLHSLGDALCIIRRNRRQTTRLQGKRTSPILQCEPIHLHLTLCGYAQMLASG
jgi:hypothetical protein